MRHDLSSRGWRATRLAAPKPSRLPAVSSPSNDNAASSPTKKTARRPGLSTPILTVVHDWLDRRCADLPCEMLVPRREIDELRRRLLQFRGAVRPEGNYDAKTFGDEIFNYRHEVLVA